MKGPLRVACWLVAASVCAGRGEAQSPRAWAFGAHVTGGLWVGAADVLDGGVGLDGTVWRRVTPHVSLRADGMIMPLDISSAPSESAGNRVFLLGSGPELDAGAGPVSVYGRALAGIAVNQQVRSGSALEERGTRAFAFGGGVGIRLGVATSFALDIGGDILKVGALDFARRSDSSPPSVSTDSAVLRLRVGVRIGEG